MARVHVVIAGEDSEGGSICAVFKVKRMARKYVSVQYATWQAEHSDDDNVERWHNAGCDWVEIQTHEVR